MKVTNKEVIEKNKKKYGWFAKSDILGSYDFYTTIISLDSIEGTDLEAIKNDQVHLKKVKARTEKLRLSTYEKLKKVYPLAHHEYTHFIDSTSTLWGMKYLLEMKEAYQQNTKKYQSNELDFYKSRLFYNKVKSFRLPDYYTELGSAESRKPWRYIERAGNRFSLDGKVSDHPIFFVHFQNCDKEFLVRSPLSMISILESSAMAQELINNQDLIASLPGDKRAVQEALYNKEVMSLVYDKNLTEYSVCCHLISNDQHYSGVSNSLKACFLINRIVLNFPNVAFERLSQIENLDSILSIYEQQYIEKVRNGFKNRDYGTLFFVLSKLLPINSLESVPQILSGLELALEKLGSPLNQIKLESEEEMNAVYKDLIALPASIIDTIANSGMNNYGLINWSVSRLPFNKLELPCCYLGDLSETVILSKVDSPLSRLKLDDVFDELNAGQGWVEKLSEACI
ncbi:hypothetical protein [Aliivibrio fischeri]|uniref:hypothetical protein n=1 Tax=Aliivibrio fischeri TaxID=668 RepID=UPI003735357C